MKHYRMNFKGEKSLDEIHAAVGKDGAQVTRVHVEKGETQVFFAGGEGKHDRVSKALGSGAPVEVREEEVARIG